MFRPGLNIDSYRGRCAIASRRHLFDRQHMRPRGQPRVKAATLHDTCDRTAIDLKIKTEIPSEVCRPIDGDTARRDVISSEVAGASLRKGANEHCASKNQHQKNFREAVF